MNLTIAKKMTIFGIVTVVLLLISLAIKYSSIQAAQKNFDIYSAKAVAGKILVLQIGKDLNYVSRCTRDIMLGNAYDKNIGKIEKSRASIVKSFDDLVDTIKGTPNETGKLEALAESKTKTLAFVDDGYNKMLSLKNQQRTPELLATTYQSYKKDATPLANASRTAFSKIIKAKDKGLKKRTAMYHQDMRDLLQFIILETIILLFLIIGYLIFLTKNITTSMKEFKIGLDSFFQYMNTKQGHPQSITIKSKDEFHEMATLINNSIHTIEKAIEEEQTLINSAKSTMHRVKNGWYSETISQTTSNKTLEDFKNDVNDMIIATKKNISSVSVTLEEFANLNYKNDLVINNIEKNGVFELLVKDINKLKETITKMLVDNKINGLTLQSSADSLLENVDILSTSSNETAAALEETAAALEEITSNISSNTNNVAQMASYAKDVTSSVQKGQELAHKTTDAMEEINTEVMAINDAISVIDQIAFQTNILSLNAAVEAATAGEAGKGFAVVAQEVRNLASRSAEAANEIKKIVEEASTKANSGKKIATEMIEGYSNLNTSISKTIDLINDVQTASKEQQSGIIQINDAVSSLDRQTQKNASIAVATKGIAEQTDHIAKLIVSDANEKEFNGKETLRARDNTPNKTISISTASQPMKEKAPTKSPSKQIAPIVSKSNDDEWASF
jgi:methyl-accepting chemotaxis protein